MADREPEKSYDPRIDMILTLAGVVSLFALIVFFAIEQLNPATYVLPDRTIVVMLSIIASLLGIKTVLPGTSYRSDGGKRADREESDRGGSS